MFLNNFWAVLGANTEGEINLIDIFGNPSNIVKTDNPSFTLLDFSSIFPIFSIAEQNAQVTDGKIPYPVFSLFKSMADKAIKFDRYFGNWKYLMCLYIAHFLSLWLKTQEGDANAADALRGSMPTGVATSKSVDGLSVSYDLLGVTDDLKDYGTWKLTVYGQQLVMLVKTLGHVGMWVNG